MCMFCEISKQLNDRILAVWLLLGMPSSSKCSSLLTQHYADLWKHLHNARKGSQLCNSRCRGSGWEATQAKCYPLMNVTIRAAEVRKRRTWNEGWKNGSEVHAFRVLFILEIINSRSFAANRVWKWQFDRSIIHERQTFSLANNRWLDGMTYVEHVHDSRHNWRHHKVLIRVLQLNWK